MKHSEGMPAVCNKCRRCRPQFGDTWCLGCSAWEVIGQELTSVWEGPPGLREVGNDLVLAAARSIRALRSLGAGISRAPGAGVPEPSVPPRTRAPPVAPPAVPVLTASKSAPTGPAASEYSYTEEEYTPEREESL